MVEHRALGAGFQFRLAVLFGMPVSREAFFAAAERRPISDYVAGVLRGQSPERAWRQVGYNRICAAAQEFAAEAQQFGGEVCADATLADFTRMSRDADVIIVAAHWKGPSIFKRDLLRDSNAFAAAARGSAAPAAKIVCDWRGGAWRRALSSRRDEDSRRTVIESLLNEVVVSGKLLKLLPKMDKHEAAELAAPLSRDLLDEAFPDDLAPGNRLELQDGLHAPGAIHDALSPTFCGEIDLSACQSVVLTRYLGAALGERALILHNTSYLDPLPRYRLLQEALARAAGTGSTYHDARLSADRDLVLVRRHMQSQPRRKVWPWL